MLSTVIGLKVIKLSLGNQRMGKYNFCDQNGQENTCLDRKLVLWELWTMSMWKWALFAFIVCYFILPYSHEKEREKRFPYASSAPLRHCHYRLAQLLFHYRLEDNFWRSPLISLFSTFDILVGTSSGELLNPLLVHIALYFSLFKAGSGGFSLLLVCAIG